MAAPEGSPGPSPGPAPGAVAFESVEASLKAHLQGKDYDEVRRILYGRAYPELKISAEARQMAEKGGYEIQGYEISAQPEQLRAPRKVRVACVQNSIVLPTTAPIEEQKNAIHKKVGGMVEAAALAGANIVCLQETFMMPFAFCTRERLPWTEFAESAEYGPTIKYFSEIAARHGIVIISPILERDESKDDVIWNAAVVISHTGKVIGKSRKNHIPRVGDFNEVMRFHNGLE
ncbi:hypothetical protein Y032_0082g1524 [Ancylostoma ceylanicum]|uniref:CN hydrolase domain-containing protein n=1 Tax=Ancylostoma ceylanicum TaxID=53326 RepID=A0A016TRF0_9BILA|nr:hypothetical protein Y032_0082g1524 [Ancylostoma ceylanicum]